MKDWIFRLGFATLWAHELDAIARGEWRVLPLTSFLPDQVGYVAFVVLHIPLLAVLVYLLSHANSVVRMRTELAISGFLLVHVGLHLLFSGHHHYDFHSLLSKALIFGGAALGALHLILSWRQNKDS